MFLPTSRGVLFFSRHCADLGKSGCYATLGKSGPAGVCYCFYLGYRTSFLHTPAHITLCLFSIFKTTWKQNGLIALSGMAE